MWRFRLIGGGRWGDGPVGLFTVNTVRDVVELRQACEIPPELLLECIFPLGRQEPARDFTSPLSLPPARRSCSHCCAAQNNRIARGDAALSNNEARRTFQRRDKLQSTPPWEYGTGPTEARQCGGTVNLPNGEKRRSTVNTAGELGRGASAFIPPPRC